MGIDLDLLWSRIYDVIIKTILCGENYVVTAMRKSRVHRTNCFEMLGFDILIDSDLKPWLIEVNLSSSMATESPLDLKIKSNLMSLKKVTLLQGYATMDEQMTHASES